MADNLHALLNPRSVAVIGISRNPDSFGYPLVEIAQRCGYEGELHLVNPNADMILGLKCYDSVLDVPGEVDVALIMVPKKLTSAAVEDCTAKGVKGIVIITAGFAEDGADGGALQTALVEKARTRGIRIVGPNTLGYYSAPAKLDALMSGFIKPGHTALITQSGNLTTSLTFPGAERGLGFSYVVGLGNQADVEVHDFVRYFRDDPHTRSIAIHIEGLRDGRQFVEEVREAAKVKPVVVLKSGRTEAGAKVVASHTASIAGNDAIYSAALKQAGAIQVHDIAEFTSLLMAFNQQKTAAGNRVCVISEGGGDCALTSDACVQKGLVVPELSQATQDRLKQFIPPNGSVVNPIDLAGWENVVEATEAAINDASIDGVIIVGGFAGFFNISPKELDKERIYVERMCDLIGRSSKPILIYSYFASYKPSELVDILQKHNVPLFYSHHDAVNTMAALVKQHENQSRQGTWLAKRDEQPAIEIDPAIRESARRGSLLEPEAKQLLRAYDLPYPDERIAETPDEAVRYAETIGYPVAMKIISKDISHKSDAGCVKLTLGNENDVRQAYDDIIANARRYDPTAELAGVLVTRMDVTDGVEVIIGGLNDPVFGPVVMFGLGGIFVEVLKDVAFRVCPLDHTETDAMIREIAAFPLLTGARGTRPVDLEAIREALMKVSQLLMDNPYIAEVDLNPIKVHAEGLLVLDARMITLADQPVGSSAEQCPA
ncbi:acetate--CoA ligase family protein [Phycisphaerales bacterium AB-hyl4]|uniref:Acetate--CoA ligase family protein n=1 Tax=Natronomicrosphaera hydrolytica TaxID=3242702 RepID=A0ABV4U3K4_9BACT